MSRRAQGLARVCESQSDSVASTAAPLTRTGALACSRHSQPSPTPRSRLRRSACSGPASWCTPLGATGTLSPPAASASASGSVGGQAKEPLSGGPIALAQNVAKLPCPCAAPPSTTSAPRATLAATVLDTTTAAPTTTSDQAWGSAALSAKHIPAGGGSGAQKKAMRSRSPPADNHQRNAPKEATSSNAGRLRNEGAGVRRSRAARCKKAKALVAVGFFLDCLVLSPTRGLALVVAVQQHIIGASPRHRRSAKRLKRGGGLYFTGRSWLSFWWSVSKPF